AIVEPSSSLNSAVIVTPSFSRFCVVFTVAIFRSPHCWSLPLTCASARSPAVIIESIIFYPQAVSIPTTLRIPCILEDAAQDRSKPERLVFTWPAGPKSLVTVTFEEVGGRTKLTKNKIRNTAWGQAVVGTLLSAITGFIGWFIHQPLLIAGSVGGVLVGLVITIWASISARRAYVKPLIPNA